MFGQPALVVHTDTWFLIPARHPTSGRHVVVKCTTKDTKFGDYQCNLAMQLFKASKTVAGGTYSFQKPRDVGEAVVAAMPAAATAMVSVCRCSSSRVLVRAVGLFSP